MEQDLKSRINQEIKRDLRKVVGARIRAQRIQQHITQDKLAEALNVSVKHISSVERGHSSLSLERMIDTSYILNCSLEYLVLGESSSSAAAKLPPFVIEIMNSKDEEEIRRLTRYLSLYSDLRPSVLKPGETT